MKFYCNECGEITDNEVIEDPDTLKRLAAKRAQQTDRDYPELGCLQRARRCLQCHDEFLTMELPEQLLSTLVAQCDEQRGKLLDLMKIDSEGGAPLALEPAESVHLLTRTVGAGSAPTFKPSAALAAVVGAGPLLRTDVAQKLWAYILLNDLKDPKNKRMINCDAKLKEIFGKAQISMFDMSEKIGKHLS